MLAGCIHHSDLPFLGSFSHVIRTALDPISTSRTICILRSGRLGLRSAIAPVHQRLNIYLPIKDFYFIQQMLNPQSKILLPGVISASITSLSTDCGAYRNYLCSVSSIAKHT